MNDILFSADLEISIGDFVIGDSFHQHTKHLLSAQKGEYKQHPEVGVGIANMLADDLYTELLIEAKKQLEYDGQTVKNISFSDGKILTIENFL